MTSWLHVMLTDWGRVTHICVSRITNIGSDNGLSPGRRQAIIWINAGILLIGPLGTNFSEILIRIQTFSFKKVYLKMSSAKWRPFCLVLNVLMIVINKHIDGTVYSWFLNQRYKLYCILHYKVIVSFSSMHELSQYVNPLRRSDACMHQ